MKKGTRVTNVGIIGMGLSGVAAANLAVSLGHAVFVSEASSKATSKKSIALLKKSIAYECGGHSKKLLDADLIVKSPGVPNDLPILAAIRKKKIPVLSELEFAFQHIEPKAIIAITGTNGKTTTTTLVGALCKKAGFKTIVAGNIGNPLSNVVRAIDSRTVLVMEISSYQLENSPSFHPQIGAILNITEDHIEHHRSMSAYIKAKAGIFAHQARGDYRVLNYDNPACRALGGIGGGTTVFFSRKKMLSRGVYAKDGKIIIDLNGKKTELSARFKLPGLHNLENILAAVAMAYLAGIKKEVIEKVLSSFKGVEHRLELVREKNGVTYINDSKGTNVDSTKVALESFGGRIWAIMGGRDKGFPYTPLRRAVKQKVKGIFLIGEAAWKIKKDLAGTTSFYHTNTLARAVAQASSMAKTGDIVLLSPACASFDQFLNFEDRGTQFKALVKSL